MKNMKKKPIESEMIIEIESKAHEAKEKKAMKEMDKKKSKKTVIPKSKPLKKKFERKVGKVMEEFKEGKLHPGSHKAPATKNKKQAIAIALSEAKKAVSKKKKKK